VKRQYGTATMSSLGFSLDRNFNASDATKRRARGLSPVAANARRNSGFWTRAPIAGLALALFGALAAKFLF
jgi:hypothetical protein